MNLLGDELSILLFFTPNLHTAKSPDETRSLWNDPKFIPKFFSNKKDEPRAEKSLDWTY